MSDPGPLRPMPGPPEHDLDTREHDGDPAEWCTRCHLINMPDIWAPAPKRLTDAECAAEYWRAGWIADHDFHDEHEADEASTWHRFATHPHADLEGVTP